MIRLRSGDAYRDLGLVFASVDGRVWNPSTFSSSFYRLARKADLQGLRFHDLRHSHATQLFKLGVHPKIVSERLGHASIGITLDTYSHVLPSMQQDAADAFDEIFAE